MREAGALGSCRRSVRQLVEAALVNQQLTHRCRKLKEPTCAKPARSAVSCPRERRGFVVGCILSEQPRPFELRTLALNVESGTTRSTYEPIRMRDSATDWSRIAVPENHLTDPNPASLGRNAGPPIAPWNQGDSEHILETYATF